MAKRSIEPAADRHLLSRLVCPVTGGPLDLSQDHLELVSRSAKLAFPIRDGIPILVVGEARELTEAEIDRFSK